MNRRKQSSTECCGIGSKVEAEWSVKDEANRTRLAWDRELRGEERCGGAAHAQRILKRFEACVNAALPLRGSIHSHRFELEAMGTSTESEGFTRSHRSCNLRRKGSGIADEAHAEMEMIAVHTLRACSECAGVHPVNQQHERLRKRIEFVTLDGESMRKCAVEKIGVCAGFAEFAAAFIIAAVPAAGLSKAVPKKAAHGWTKEWQVGQLAFNTKRETKIEEGEGTHRSDRVLGEEFVEAVGPLEEFGEGLFILKRLVGRFLANET